MQPEDKLPEILARTGHKTTTVRKRIYSLLLDVDQPLSNSELVKLASDLDKVSVYRTIALFESIGVIHRIWNGFKSKIELDEELSPHHHHFSCTICGRVSSFDDEELEKTLAQIALKLGVSVKRHLIELSGTCSSCSVKSA